MHPKLESRFQQVSVLIIGDIMLDEFIIGSVSRISPEAPVPVLDVRERRNVLGGAANVAANVISLGASAVLCGLAAADPAGLTLRGLLTEAGITGALVDCGSRGTICKTRIIAGRQQVVRIDHEDRNPVPEAILEEALVVVRQRIATSDVVVLSDYAKGLLAESFCRQTLAEASRLGKYVIIDPKGRNFAKYSGCSIITPNLSEAASASKVSIETENDLRRAGAELRDMLPGASILITRGADGMTLFEEGREPLTMPAVARQVFDVVGAGDTVVAALAVSVAAGLGLPDAMRFANVAAGVAVDKPGTATVTVGEILSHDPSLRDLLA